jgi:hypothetical protein
MLVGKGFTPPPPTPIMDVDGRQVGEKPAPQIEVGSGVVLFAPPSPEGAAGPELYPPPTPPI